MDSRLSLHGLMLRRGSALKVQFVCYFFWGLLLQAFSETPPYPLNKYNRAQDFEQLRSTVDAHAGTSKQAPLLAMASRTFYGSMGDLMLQALNSQPLTS